LKQREEADEWLEDSYVKNAELIQRRDNEIKELKEALRLFENATTVKLFNEAKDKAKKLLE